MQLFFIKNIFFYKFNDISYSKKAAFRLPHITHAPTPSPQPPPHKQLYYSSSLPKASDSPLSFALSHLVSPSAAPQADPASHSISHQPHADIHLVFLQAHISSPSTPIISSSKSALKQNVQFLSSVQEYKVPAPADIPLRYSLNHQA